MGGSDVCPESYGERRCSPSGTATASATTTRSRCCARSWRGSKPVLGICRGAQIINVAQGGTLWQDLGTQVPGALNHRNWAIYAENCHATSLVPGTGLAHALPGGDGGQDELRSITRRSRTSAATSSSKRGRSPTASSRRSATPGPGYVFAVQWHPEFHAPDDPSFLDDTPILDEFLSAAARHKAAAFALIGSPMKITNPADGTVITEVTADNATAVRRKYELARAGQPKWAKVPLKKRLADRSPPFASASSRCTKPWPGR